MSRQRVIEEEPPPSIRGSKPGFGALLKKFGVVEEGDSASEHSDEDEDSEEGRVEDCEQDAEEGEVEVGSNVADGRDGLEDGSQNNDADDDDADDDDDGDEDEDEDDDDDKYGDGGAGDEEGGQDGNDDADNDEVDNEDGNVFTKGSEKKSEKKPGLDFYPSFWQEPKQAARGSSQFSLPGLARSEAVNADVASIVADLGSKCDAQECWQRCRLARGLRKRWEEFVKSQGTSVGAREGSFFAFLHAYLDVAFAQHTFANSSWVRSLYMLHVVDHLVKSRIEVVHNNSASKLSRMGAKSQANAGDAPMAMADMGFTRARALILCPFRSVCFELVQTLIALCPNLKQVMNRERFTEQFGPDGDEMEDDGAHEDGTDLQHIFKGNIDDRFCLGISLSKNTLKLYAAFDRCDLLICSPLGLRQITGAEGDRKREFDFLSSIETCVVDRADILRMQNWEHVVEVLRAVNQRPRDMRNVDISRLRQAFADGRARAFRQTVVTSSGQSADVEALFAAEPRADAASVTTDLATKLGVGAPAKKRRKHRKLGDDLDSGSDAEAGATEMRHAHGDSGCLQSCRGLVRLVDPPDGAPLRQVTALGTARQCFLHVGCADIAQRNDCLLQAFKSRYWQPLGHGLQRLLIVAGSYLGFLQLRRFLREEDASFSCAFEYSKNRDLSRARFRFFHGHRRVLLVTERFLWYRRYRIKGSDYVLFVGPPEVSEIYEHAFSGMRTPSECNSMCLFTKFDCASVERIVGQEHARRLLATQSGKVFIFS